MTKPHYEPTFSLGNVLVIIGGLFVAGTVWAAFAGDMSSVRQVGEANKKAIQAVEERVARVEERLDSRLERMESKMDQILANQGK